MEKTKLAICIEDEEYRQRFVKCVMNHYKERFEFYVVNDINELKASTTEEFGVVIIGEDNDREEYFLEKQVVLVLLDENKNEVMDENENVFYTKKYQEVYKIMEDLQRIIDESIYPANQGTEKTKIQRIGVFSLSKEVMQIPFAALLAEILGEKHHVLMIDLQPFSGLAAEVEIEGVLGMENLISIATTRNYTVSRVMASIGHEEKWEYIYPAKNTSCLEEVGIETYQSMLEILEKQQGYSYEIINFGSMFSGVLELMESCQEVYVLTEKKEERNYREYTFLEELKRRGKTAVMQRIIWTEIPAGIIKMCSWKQLSKQWLWSSLGDILRERYWLEYTNGTVM